MNRGENFYYRFHSFRDIFAAQKLSTTTTSQRPTDRHPPFRVDCLKVLWRSRAHLSPSLQQVSLLTTTMKAFSITQRIISLFKGGPLKKRYTVVRRLFAALDETIWLLATWSGRGKILYLWPSSSTFHCLMERRQTTVDDTVENVSESGFIISAKYSN